MTASLRALRALFLLAGFYLMGLVLLAVVLGIDWLLIRAGVAGGYYPLGLVAFSAVIIAPILRGMFLFLTAGLHTGDNPGLAVTADEQPELWAQVEEAARAAGTSAPSRLILTGDVNAAVSERTQLLGLLRGRRTMYLGLPLLAGVTVPQLRAVLAHEFGHYSNQDTRLAAMTMRGREAVVHTIDGFREGRTQAHVTIGNLYVGYGRFFLRVSESVGRRQELAADAAAARTVGRDTTAAALARVPLLDAAHDYYVRTYALLAVDAGALPPAGQVYGGFPLLLAARGADGVAALAEGRRVRKPSLYDSHPPMAERVALVEALPDDGRTDDPAAPAALTLLRDATTVTAAAEAAVLRSELAALPRLDWPELVMATARAEAGAEAEQLQKAVSRAVRSAAGDDVPGAPGLPDLGEVLDAVDAGLLWMLIADRMPKPAAASRLTGESARNFIRPAISDGLTSLVELRLIADGRATPAMSWSVAPRLGLPPEYRRDLAPAVAAAVADTPDTAPLRALLATDPDPAPVPAPAPA
ncbi:M48 family metallopeptidase [Actinacidiphila paucisporea]|uniref:Zn-dependent protease with chaperone function n=1 Tax=Actinacidiphila paucisporea TaxID=310782 RepID=A0A1M7H527_9ACTN|nr:M48 family metallopeptidase [Actinacidiphila paucisporea]SHM23754.1 Zn-dependent protease with chaperone function [Actinacidiphila paucisporea]